MIRRACSLAFLLALAAQVQADELGWALDQTWRYDLVATESPQSFPAPPQLPPLRLVSATDLREARVPVWPPHDAGDLVWHYALLLPADEVPKKKATVAIEETFALSGGDMRARGEHQLRRKGRRLVIATRVELAAAKATGTVRSGVLELQRAFDLKLRRVQQVTFRLTLTAQLPDQEPVEGTWAGTIEPDRALDLSNSGFHAEVEAAIERGAAWLKRKLGPRLQSYKKKGVHHYAQGRIALPVFALLRSGLDPAELREYFDWMAARPFTKTYSVALYLMALEARSIRRQALPPVPSTRSVARYDRDPIPAADLAEIRRALAWLLAVRGDEGWWSYGGQLVDGVPMGPSGHDGTTVPKRGDRSNSQFAILALHSALAAGVDVPAEVWEDLTELLGSQQADGPLLPLEDQELAPSSPLAWDARDHAGTSERGDGGLTSGERVQGKARGWTYSMVKRTGAGAGYGSMSAAGLSSVAVVHEALRHADALTPEREREGLLSLRDGLAWLAHHYDVARNPGRGSAHVYYYLYSLEKAMDLAGVERLAGHEWWRDGAAVLLERQGKDGSWAAQIEATSFALLFLNRATLPARLDVEAIGPVATGARDLSLWDQVAVEGVGKVRARQVLRSLLRASRRDGKERLALAEAALAAMDEASAPRLLPELITLLEGGPKPVKKWAANACRALTGSDVIAEVARFSERFELLYALTESNDAERGAAAAVEILRGDPGPQLEIAGLRALTRLHGVEGVPVVISLLSAPSAQRRDAAHGTLLALVGDRCPFDPNGPASLRGDQVAAWSSWWEAEGPAEVEQEQVRRLIEALRQPARTAEAEAQLKTIGMPAVRQLIDELRAEARREAAHSLLVAITRQPLPPELEPWLAWWEETH